MPDFPAGPGKKILDQVRRTQQDQLASETVDSPHQQYLSFLLNEDWYGLSVYDLVEVLPPPKITRVPSVPDHILGVINFRGEVLSTIDLKRFFGLSQGESTEDQAIVVVEHAGVRTGLLVDDIGDLVNLAPEDLRGEPLLPGTTQRVFFEGAAPWVEGFLTVIRLEGIFQAEGMYTYQG
jgi:purine-binding chemotaxis protein CheW